MKKSLPYLALLTSTALSLFSCQKDNSVQEDLPDKRNKDLCLVSSFTYSNSSVPSTTIFTNRYDLSGRTMQVEAGVFSGGTIFTYITFDVKWTVNSVVFIDASAPQDTVLVATFDRGRIEKILPGNKVNENFLPTSFVYSGNRVQSMSITLAGKTEVSNFDYDTKGNIISISDLPTTSVPNPGKVEYKYAINEKAYEQFYFDEPRKFSWNSFSLLQYVGLFPELQPVNLRTSTKVNWGNNYIAYNMDIANHQIDQKGNLVSYDIMSPESSNTVSHYNINWTCNNPDVVHKMDNN
ncbi:MAG TPA: hypothetical protein VEV87_04985 [Chitinophagaceae bacterium]|nr:hypothetical protein [Chitinophagaceae bacterium]